jgi:hypothetical protein
MLDPDPNEMNADPQSCHNVSPLVGIGTPLSASDCASPGTKGGGGTHSPACEGVGESQFGRLGRKLVLSLLSRVDTRTIQIVSNADTIFKDF